MRAIYVVALLLLAASATAQSPAAGRLLVATETLHDSGFAETVVLLLEYHERGATGLIINRPTWVEAGEAFPELEYLDEHIGRLYLGGPVARIDVSALVRGSAIDLSGTYRVLDGVYLADRQALRQLVSAGEDYEIRLYSGAATWEAGQLEREIAQGAWRVAVAQPDLVFTDDPQALWQRLAQRLPELMVHAPSVASAIPSQE